MGRGADLADIRRRGYSIDDEEQELGVRCVAVPVDAGRGSWMAVSVSGPATRMTDDVVDRAVERVRVHAVQRRHQGRMAMAQRIQDRKSVV